MPTDIKLHLIQFRFYFNTVAVCVGFVQEGLVRSALHAPGESALGVPVLRRNLLIVDDLQEHAGAVGVQAEAVAVLLRAAAKALGKMPDALADEINALTADGEIGDIVLEDDGMGGYTVIEDYREQVIELL